ncbi:hypothetical protein GGP41_010131 [Bipolaris sorokiniana]|uniref:Uncharacterized protein n=1 Tax=Cochliobolus sativus TaxID=45130 RepID=A0A8H5ZF15_COCSA|nr:hypothetical protein GGP41_010131 [Bipolaris sorokiniana]
MYSEGYVITWQWAPGKKPRVKGGQTQPRQLSSCQQQPTKRQLRRVDAVAYKPHLLSAPHRSLAAASAASASRPCSHHGDTQSRRGRKPNSTSYLAHSS